MKKFQFRMESILRLCEFREEEKKRELASALKFRQENQGLLTFWEQRLIQNTEGLSQEKQKGLPDVRRILALEGYWAVLKRQIQEQSRKLAEAEKFVDQCRQKLADATRRKKTFSRLKEKQTRAYYDSVEKWEQKSLDEWSVLHFASKAGF